MASQVNPQTVIGLVGDVHLLVVDLEKTDGSHVVRSQPDPLLPLLCLSALLGISVPSFHRRRHRVGFAPPSLSSLAEQTPPVLLQPGSTFTPHVLSFPFSLSVSDLWLNPAALLCLIP